MIGKFDFHLVQRMFERKEPIKDKKGVDAFFSQDYMGAAEFEFGTLPKTLQRMRADSVLSAYEIVKIPIAQENAILKNLWAVCLPKQVDTVKEFVAEQLTGSSVGLKEPTYLRGAVLPPKDRFDYVPNPPVDGWWAIDLDVPFAFFRTKDIARKWLKALAQK